MPARAGRRPAVIDYGHDSRAIDANLEDQRAMTADDLNAPLGQQPTKRRFAIPITASQVLGGALTLFLGAFVLWAALGNNPFGGEPMVVAKINAPSAPAASGTPNVLSGTPNRYDGPAGAPPQVVQ